MNVELLASSKPCIFAEEKYLNHLNQNNHKRCWIWEDLLYNLAESFNNSIKFIDMSKLVFQ